MIKKLLIANRGEIAVRIIKAAKEMGIRTVAVFSDADKDAIHPQLADEAVHIGPPEPSSSYLDQSRIIEVAQATGADAVHPGYGFLSERVSFAQACADAGLIFVGPPPRAMQALGDKIASKALAETSGVPVTPGLFRPGATEAELERAAAELGFPVMLKASAGGGGRGMRAVRAPQDFIQELRLASEEALKAFGDGSMLVEKLIEQPRHIEAQVLADSHGNTAVLFERECSVQRRHQKLIEEAPFAQMSSDLWQRMRGSVEKLVQASGYVGAGTVEFMVDAAGKEFYFLEVNARLQVEHPVTEAITGVDLVQWQLAIASGESLSGAMSADLIAGERSAINGHAIEVRIVAEDPAKNFLPSVGAILGWSEPKAPGIRVDTGFGKGREISRYYDSLIAKVIAHAATRDQAIRRLCSALREFHILGVATNIEYLIAVLEHPEFLAGNTDTGFLGRHFAEWQPRADVPEAIGLLVGMASAQDVGGSPASPDSSAWAMADGFRVTS